MTGACPEQQLLLNAYLDGELDAANTAQLDAHLAGCGNCRDELERLRTLHWVVTNEAVSHAMPESVRSNVMEALADERQALPTPRDRGSWWAPALGGAIAASLAFAAILPLQQQSRLDDELIAGHVRSLQVQHLTDVQTSNEHVVKPWFNGKIDFSPPVPDLAAQGFPLAGGRLDYVGGHTVAALVYKRRLHTINLFVWPSSGGERRVHKDGYSIDEWTEGGLRYAAVSDIAPGDLDQFRRGFIAATE